MMPICGICNKFILKDFIADFPTIMCSPPSDPKAIMDLRRYGNGKKFGQ